jgi:formylglycine-generating enzyme required for sulfatase activity
MRTVITPMGTTIFNNGDERAENRAVWLSRKFKSSTRIGEMLLLATILLVSSQLLVPQPLHAQTAKELAKEDILKLLSAEVASRRIEALVEERGIAFELTPEVEQELKRAGANADLIEVIRANSKPPSPAELVVESSPGGAEVYLDSQSVARTSAGGWGKISPLPPGRHQLRIVAPGFDDFTQTIELKSGETLNVNAVLTKAKEPPAILFVNSTPPGANVTLDGKSVGGTGGAGRLKIPDLEPGKHVIRVTMDGYVNFEQAVELVSGKALTVTAALEHPKPATAGIVLQAVPRGSTVTLDDKVVDQSSLGGDLNIPDLTPGTHRVKVAADGYIAFEQNVELGSGSVLTLRPTLLPLVPTAGLARLNPIDGLKYVWIAAGTFMMGCSPGEAPQCLPDEKPSHRVTIREAFWLGQTEVTVQAYKRYVAAKGISMPDEPVFGNTALNPGWAEGLAPMVNVSRTDAENYCAWAGGRLPSEAEWEFAARGGTTEGRYGPVDDIAWYANNSGRSTLDSELIWRHDQKSFSDRLSANGNTFHPVAQKKPNAYNLYDILGNVWEWVSDWYDEKYYSSAQEIDPRGPSSGTFAIQRGGSWYTGPRVSRAAPRYKVAPDSRGFSIGIRCARNAAP